MALALRVFTCYAILLDFSVLIDLLTCHLIVLEPGNDDRNNVFIDNKTILLDLNQRYVFDRPTIKLRATIFRSPKIM